MKKIASLSCVLGIGLMLSFYSFNVGSVEPTFGPPTGGELCRALMDIDLKDITYHRGLPVQKSDTVSFDVACGNSDSYTPSHLTIIRSWQFYVNWAFYSSVLLGIFVAISKARKH